MRNKLGDLCMVIGVALIVGALALFLYNQRQASAAQQASQELVTQLVAQLEEVEPPAESLDYANIPLEYLDPASVEMTEVEINGYAYIGYLSIPGLGLELPVMSDWDYDKLQISPCRYYGSVLGQDLVLMAHNYPKHFGNISKLTAGNSVFFTDMDGVVTEYTVVAQDVLEPYAVEEMTAGDFDLTLFTCTYGGANRVTVYCDRAANK